jgi:hypothetical protein
MTAADDDLELEEEDPPQVVPLAWLLKALFKIWKRITR